MIDTPVTQGRSFTIDCNISDSCPLPTTICLSANGQVYNLTDTRTRMFPAATSSASYTCRADNGQAVSIVYMVRIIATSTLCKLKLHLSYSNYYHFSLVPSASTTTTVRPSTSPIPTVIGKFFKWSIEYQKTNIKIHCSTVV